jgi:hypothetical protein
MSSSFSTNLSATVFPLPRAAQNGFVRVAEHPEVETAELHMILRGSGARRGILLSWERLLSAFQAELIQFDKLLL